MTGYIVGYTFNGWNADFQPPFYVWASQHGTTALDPEQVQPWQA